MIAAVLSLALAAAIAPEPTLRLDAPKSTGRVGDALEITLAVDGAPVGSQFEFPNAKAPFGDLEVKSWTGEGATRTYRLRTFVSGDHLVPKLAVTLHPPGDAASIRLETEEKVLTFESVVPDDAKDIRPEKGSLPILAPLPWLAIGAAVAVLIVASALMSVKRRERKKKAAPPPPPVPPDIAALRAIDELERSGLAARGPEGVREHFYRLSAILRTYVEARFGIAAPDMTSEEFLEASARSSVLPAGHRDSLREFMRVSDLAKYALFSPGAAEIGSTLEAARRFVLDTPAIPAPADTAMVASAT